MSSHNIMSKDKKYKIISNIVDDAPFGEINWCTISFLTPQNMESLKMLDIKGFKVHNGYNNTEMADIDAKKIKNNKKEHDVFLAQVGKLYAWDDVNKTDMIEYDNDKLNDLEKTRRENISKMKLMKEQFDNESNNHNDNSNKNRIEKIRKRMLQKLYQKGMVSKREMELMQEDKTNNVSSSNVQKLEKIENEIEEVYKKDYLDENDPSALKYGCISIFNPKQIKGLKLLCFKIRGLFETQEELNKRVSSLLKLYPDDSVYTFEIGKWCPITDDINITPDTKLKRLNYAMKCYLDSLTREKQEFEERKETLQKQTEIEAKQTKAKNYHVKNDLPNDVPNKINSFGNPEDDAVIKQIIDYLDEPKLSNKFSSNESHQEH